ncbi:MAG: hypothetical protein ACM3O3_08580 [Syntrophothermus sp.]
MYRKLLLVLVISLMSIPLFAQDVTTKNDSIVESMNSTIKELKKIKISGYIQTQWQLAESEGIKSFSGGDFPADSKSRFMVRRGRLKATYDNVLSKYVLQFDITEKGFAVKDVYANFKDPWTKSFGLTAGVFERPFGFEIGYSSSLRESPERSRLFQTLFPNERDLGAMLSYIPADGMLSFLNVQAGVFTGNGTSPETDNYKDFIGRVGFQTPAKKEFQISGGVSGYFGKVKLDTRKSAYINSTVDSVNRGYDRTYLGADLQVNFQMPVLGNTALRGEYITGKQPGNQNTSSYYKVGSGDLYLRDFNGYYAMLVQNLGEQNQLVAKYDVYDPNRKDNDNTYINSAGDMKFSTLGLGWLYYFDKNIKFTLYYEMIKNEGTVSNPIAFVPLAKDIKDNVLTLRMQYKF